MEPLDTKALIAEVAARHGILLKSNDAAFALVTMNEMVLEQSLSIACEEIERKIQTFNESIQRIERLAGKVLAQEVKAATADAREEIRSDVDAARLKVQEVVEIMGRASRKCAHRKWFAIGLAAALLALACGFVLGQLAPSLL